MGCDICTTAFGSSEYILYCSAPKTCETNTFAHTHAAAVSHKKKKKEKIHFKPRFNRAHNQTILARIIRVADQNSYRLLLTQGEPIGFYHHEYFIRRLAEKCCVETNREDIIILDEWNRFAAWLPASGGHVHHAYVVEL